jgi:acyl carrier protein
MDVKQQVQDIVVRTLNIKPGEIRLGMSLENSLGVDSTEMVEITVALSKKFNVSVQDKEISKKSTIEDIEKVIKSKLG